MALFKLAYKAQVYESGEIMSVVVMIILNKQFEAYLKLAQAKQRRQSAEPQTLNSEPWLDLALGSMVTGRQQDTL